MPLFSPEMHEVFAANYPERAHRLVHQLGTPELFSLEGVARLAEALPDPSVHFNHCDLPLGVDKLPSRPDQPIGETIRNIATSGCWFVLQRIEQVPEYAEFLKELWDELRPFIEPRTGEMLKLQGFVLVTSPNGVAPYHFDPEHNILLQIHGSKVMTQFPPGDTRYATDVEHEVYHRTGHNILTWSEELRDGAMEFELKPGDGVYVPVKAPHFVVNGPEVSISLSVTWQSEWVFAETDAHYFNSVLRRFGVTPKSTGRWPDNNLAKAYGWRALRRSGLHTRFL